MGLPCFQPKDINYPKSNMIADAYTASGGVLIFLAIIAGAILGLLALFMPYFVYRIYLYTLDINNKMDHLILELRMATDEQRKFNALLKKALNQA